MMDRFLVLLVALLSLSYVRAQNCSEYASNSAVQLFQEYVRINTTTYNNLTEAVEFWQALAAEEDVPITVTYFTAGFPVIVIKWEGTNTSAPSIMLNSHMDVVPADESEGWKYPPFNATLTADCKIWGRGTQDMKSVSMQYWQALKALKADNATLTRPVYMTLMPDEEVGAANGMQKFLASEQFAEMNVGLEMDEGTSYDLNLSALFKQDKAIWQIMVTCTGVAAHGSTFPATNTTAVGKCHNVTNTLFKFRDEQQVIATAATVLNAGVYTSLNLNYIDSFSTAYNIIPESESQVYDIRLATALNEETFEAQLTEWIAESGDNITMTFVIKNPQSPATLTTSDNPYYEAIVAACANVSLPIYPLVAPGSTDARFVRNAGIPAFGFSPMPNTTLLLHSVDEHLSVETFLNGIAVYKSIITNLANIDPALTSTNGSDYLVSTSSSGNDTTVETSTEDGSDTDDQKPDSDAVTLIQKLIEKIKKVLESIRN